MVIFPAVVSKEELQTARKRSLCVMARIKVAGEGGKKFYTSGVNLHLFFFFFSPIPFASLRVSYHTFLNQILPLSYLNPSGICRGDQGDVPSSLIC